MDDDPDILTFRFPLLRAKRRRKMPAGRPTLAFSAPTPSDPSILADDRPTAVLDARKPGHRPQPRKRPDPDRISAPRKPHLHRQLADDLARLEDLESQCHDAYLAVEAAKSNRVDPAERKRLADDLTKLGGRVLGLNARINRTWTEIERCW